MMTVDVDSSLAVARTGTTVTLGVNSSGSGLLHTFCTLSTNANLANTTTYMQATGTNTTENLTRRVVVRAGQLRTLAVHLTAAPGAGTSRIFVVRLNGVNTALSVTLSGGAAVFGTSTGNVAVAAGDVITVQCSVTSFPNAGNAAATIEISYT